MILPITNQEINQNKVASLPSRPNASVAFGGAGYTSAQLKAAFDRLPLLLAERYNALVEAIQMQGDDSLLNQIPTGIVNPEGGYYTLSELLYHIKDGRFATYLRVGTSYLDLVLDALAPLDSPALLGSPTAPTPDASDTSGRIATTAFVQKAVAQLREAVEALQGGTLPEDGTAPEVDQAYNPNSANAQSGTAVYQAMAEAITIAERHSTDFAEAYTDAMIGRLSLGIGADGLLYVFANGSPIGDGIALEGGAIGDVIGTLDENNNIILTGDLADGTYTLKYENADGTYSEIGTLEVAENAEPSIENLALPDATATGQAAWESGGWCNDSYMAGTSYAYREATDGRITTNTIAVEYGDTIYVKGMTYQSSVSPQLAIFDESGGYIKHAYVGIMLDGQSMIADLNATAGSDDWYFTNANKTNGADIGTRFIRIAGVPSGSINDIVITRNQPIV